MSKYIKPISIDDVYVSVLTEKRVRNEQGMEYFEKIKREIPPTGSIIMDAMMKVILERRVYTTRGLVCAMEVRAYKLSAAIELLTGYTLPAFLALYRTRAAREYLECTDIDVQEVGRRLGWNTPAGFNHAFIDRVGIPPLKYRQQNRPKDFRYWYRWE